MVMCGGFWYSSVVFAVNCLSRFFSSRSFRLISGLAEVTRKVENPANLWLCVRLRLKYGRQSEAATEDD